MGLSLQLYSSSGFRLKKGFFVKIYDPFKYIESALNAIGIPAVVSRTKPKRLNANLSMNLFLTDNYNTFKAQVTVPNLFIEQNSKNKITAKTAFFRN